MKTEDASANKIKLTVYLMIQVLSTNDREGARCLFEIDRRRHHASTLVLS